MNTNPEK